MTRKEFLQEAERIVCSDRENQYGAPENNFGAAFDAAFGVAFDVLAKDIESQVLAVHLKPYVLHRRCPGHTGHLIEHIAGKRLQRVRLQQHPVFVLVFGVIAPKEQIGLGLELDAVGFLGQEIGGIASPAYGNTGFPFQEITAVVYYLILVNRNIEPSGNCIQVGNGPGSTIG